MSSGPDDRGVLGFPADEFDAVRAAGLDPAEGYAGVPDAYQRTWVPHRMLYIGEGAERSQHACAFCEAPHLDEEHSLIVHQGEHAFVVMNLYPYNSGHLLVCPNRHFAMYDEATTEEVAEIGALTQTAMRVIRADAGVAGFNLGMNQGEVAGAGIAGHLHQHIVPRWRYDSNFMPIIARTKAMPELLGDLRDRLRALWPAADTTHA